MTSFLKVRTIVSCVVVDNRDALEFELFITYFGEDQHKSTPWSSYKRSALPSKKAPQINVRNK